MAGRFFFSKVFRIQIILSHREGVFLPFAFISSRCKAVAENDCNNVADSPQIVATTNSLILHNYRSAI